MIANIQDVLMKVTHLYTHRNEQGHGYRWNRRFAYKLYEQEKGMYIFVTESFQTTGSGTVDA